MSSIDIYPWIFQNCCIEWSVRRPATSEKRLREAVEVKWLRDRPLPVHPAGESDSFASWTKRHKSFSVLWRLPNPVHLPRKGTGVAGGRSEHVGAVHSKGDQRGENFLGPDASSADSHGRRPASGDGAPRRRAGRTGGRRGTDAAPQA